MNKSPLLQRSFLHLEARWPSAVSSMQFAAIFFAVVSFAVSAVAAPALAGIDVTVSLVDALISPRIHESINLLNECNQIKECCGGCSTFYLVNAACVCVEVRCVYKDANNPLMLQAASNGITTQSTLTTEGHTDGCRA
ncbi:hypothetical protein DFH09DRAFT_1363697 [Mycena vulgaris]|nr:hypothetical protein DFH09DRAFT_1363697 [Mycena vulgaris]